MENRIGPGNFDENQIRAMRERQKAEFVAITMGKEKYPCPVCGGTKFYPVQFGELLVEKTPSIGVDAVPIACLAGWNDGKKYCVECQHPVTPDEVVAFAKKLQGKDTTEN